MTTKEANKCRYYRYDLWYPLLEKEIHLLTKPGKTKLIAIGKKVADYLRKKPLSQRVHRVLHYTKTAASHRNRAIEHWREYFSEFSGNVSKGAFEDSIREVLRDAEMDCYIGHMPEGGKPYQLTESRKKLMFYYKNRFSEIRNDLGLRS